MKVSDSSTVGEGPLSSVGVNETQGEREFRSGQTLVGGSWVLCGLEFDGVPSGLSGREIHDLGPNPVPYLNKIGRIVG